jgi:endonuclease/exonuclease/phosphatase family metal-dependent hydrolase
MLKHIKKTILAMLTGASAFTALLMVAVGYSDRLSPEAYPLLACAGLIFPFLILANLLSLVVLVIIKWKLAWIPLLGFALAYVPIRTYLPINFSKQIPEDCLTVVSYNVCGYGGNYKYDHAADTVAGYLRQVNADIVCLQEDMGGKGGNGFEIMKKLYPYNDTVHVSGANPLVNAVGIHTRFPIVGKERIEYKSVANGSVAYYLQIEDDTIIVINNHLESTHLSKDERQRYKEVLMGEMESELAKEEMHMIAGKLGVNMAIRAPQAEAVHRFIESHSQYPIIVCGDFNDTPISYARQTIAQGMTDCFVSTGCGLGLSYNQKGFNLRIDHMMCSRHFKPYGCDIDNKMDASDHYPMICRLKMDDNH